MTPGDLVEREREIAALAELLDAVPAGEGHVAWIEGPAGIGKSTLLAEARRRAAAAGTQVLAARGSELEREFPFGVVRQLFEALVSDPERREHALAGAAAPPPAGVGAPHAAATREGGGSLPPPPRLFLGAVHPPPHRPPFLA